MSKPTTGEYLRTQLRHIGDRPETCEHEPGDELCGCDPADQPMSGRLPAPPAGSVDEAVLKLRRAAHDLGDPFDLYE